MEESKILSCAWMWSSGSGDNYVFSKEALLSFAKELLSISQQTAPQPEQNGLVKALEEIASGLQAEFAWEVAEKALTVYRSAQEK